MIRKHTAAMLMLSLTGVGSPLSADEPPSAPQLFEKNCSLCHALDKKKLGPPVKAMKGDAEVLREVIIQGRNVMPSFKGKLSSVEIDALVKYLLKNIGSDKK